MLKFVQLCLGTVVSPNNVFVVISGERIWLFLQSTDNVYNWRSRKIQSWNLLFLVGAILGGFLASNYMSNGKIDVNPSVSEQLAEDYHILKGR